MIPKPRFLQRFRPAADFLEDRLLLAVTVDEFPLPARAGSVVAGLDGAMWFTQDDNRLGRMLTTGELTSYDAGAQLTGDLAVTASGDIWFTAIYQIGRFRPGAGSILFNTPDDASSSSPWRLAAGPDGNLWFTEIRANKVGRMTPAGEVTEFNIPAGGPLGALPNGIAAGLDGNVWFTELGANAIGRITPGGQITTFPCPSRNASGVSDLDGIVTGPDGNLWFTERAYAVGRITTSGQITEFTLPLPAGGRPAGISAGPDGNLWFTDMSSKAIGRITPGGQIREFAISAADGIPVGIAAAADGNIWFSENGKAQLGRLNVSYTDLAVAVTADPSGATVGKPLTYTITVTNLSLDEATNVLITNALTLGLASVTSVSTSQGTAESSMRLVGSSLVTTVVAHLGTLNPGSAATVTIVCSPPTRGTMTDSVIVQADESDRVAGNNSATLVTTVSGSSTDPPPSGGTTPPKPAYLGERRLYVGQGAKRKLAGFQLKFSAALDLASANNRIHYRLTQAGRTKKLAPTVITVKSVAVASSGLSVTLSPGKYDPKKPLQLTITGLAGAKHQSVPTIVIRL